MHMNGVSVSKKGVAVLLAVVLVGVALFAALTSSLLMTGQLKLAGDISDSARAIMAAVVSIVIGGYIYMTAGGDADRVRTAKVWIGSAILGIILALLAWLILASIATNLVKFPTTTTTTSSPTPTPPTVTSMGNP